MLRCYGHCSDTCIQRRYCVCVCLSGGSVCPFRTDLIVCDFSLQITFALRVSTGFDTTTLCLEKKNRIAMINMT